MPTKKVIATPKPKRVKKPKLTVQEKNLLEFPPTERTWVCNGTYLVWNATESKNEKKTCGTVNGGSNKECMLCGKKRSEKPKLLWPDYVSACAKVGIEPGTMWKMGDRGPLIRVKGESWKSQPEPSA